jgi:hypothetical protein
MSACLAGLALLIACRAPLEAQNEVWSEAGRVDWSEFRIANVVPHGQPLVPYTEGWFTNADGTKTASFSYFNLNTEETFDIPLGPDNFIEPRELDGRQPTHFLPASSERGRNRRHESTFTVTVPGDFEGQVVWTLRAHGVSASASSLFGSTAHDMFDLETASDAPVAPIMRIADSEPRRGRNGPTAGPVTVRVGQSLPLELRLDLLGREKSVVNWYHHQGPGEVTFVQSRFDVTADEGEAVLATLATFSQAGEYVLRATAIETTAALVQHCCWTNGYLYVTVTP